MYRYLKEVLERYTRIVVWGTGNFYLLYGDLLDERVVYIIDNKKEKCGMSLDGKVVFSPEKLKEEDPDKTLIIICNHYFEEISTQIKQYGDFDIIDIVTMDLLQKKEKENKNNTRTEDKVSSNIIVCGGIHAMWQTNGSRRFIEGQLEHLHQAGFHTIETIPLLYYLEGKRESSFLAVSVNRIYQGILSIDEFVRKYSIVRGIIFHSPYYSQNTMKDLLDTMQVESQVLYYIHDYASLCSYRFLHRNQKLCIGIDGEVCCKSCDMKEEQKEILNFHQSVFDKYQVLLIAPSEDTKKRVQLFYKKTPIAVMPHLRFEQEDFRKRINDRIRIAYIGTAIWHKGWELFSRIVDQFHQKYEFYCLGDCPDELKISNVTYVPVGLYHADYISTMVEVLLRYNIDIAYIGSVWPETYSYTYYEAYEAGCFVITSALSGNVSGQVIANQNGRSFSNESDMMAWLEKGTVRRDIMSLKKRIKNVWSNDEFLKYFQYEGWNDKRTERNGTGIQEHV
ncbi:hypothetical protein IMSAGC020_01355 [Lachnospiraceae bacterium]|nr:hypothetical protein IMSAGC020_01355 [Lachnospiraceae bacterium]